MGKRREIFERGQELLSEYKKVNRELRNAYKQRGLETQNSLKLGLQVTIIIRVLEMEETEILLTYTVLDISWEPQYEVYASTTDQISSWKVKMVHNASIFQNTGEDWSNAALKLKVLAETVAPDLKPFKLSNTIHFELGTETWIPPNPEISEGSSADLRPPSILESNASEHQGQSRFGGLIPFKLLRQQQRFPKLHVTAGKREEIGSGSVIQSLQYASDSVQDINQTRARVEAVSLHPRYIGSDDAYETIVVPGLSTVMTFNKEHGNQKQIVFIKEREVNSAELQFYWESVPTEKERVFLKVRK